MIPDQVANPIPTPATDPLKQNLMQYQIFCFQTFGLCWSQIYFISSYHLSLGRTLLSTFSNSSLIIPEQFLKIIKKSTYEVSSPKTMVFLKVGYFLTVVQLCRTPATRHFAFGQNLGVSFTAPSVPDPLTLSLTLPSSFFCSNSSSPELTSSLFNSDLQCGCNLFSICRTHSAGGNSAEAANKPSHRPLLRLQPPLQTALLFLIRIYGLSLENLTHYFYLL